MDSLSPVMQALLDRVEDPTWWQAAIRAGIIFIATWGLLRLAGRRAFAQKTSFDLCIVLLLGAVLSRAVVGASSMAVALGASVVLVMLHRAVAWLSCRSPAFDRFAVGHAIDIFRHGKLDRERLHRAMISEEDLHANLRATLQAESLEGIERVVLERDGHLTFVRAPQEEQHPDKAARQKKQHPDYAAPQEQHPDTPARPPPHGGKTSASPTEERPPGAAPRAPSKDPVTHLPTR